MYQYDNLCIAHEPYGYTEEKVRRREFMNNGICTEKEIALDA